MRGCISEPRKSVLFLFVLIPILIVQLGHVENLYSQQSNSSTIRYLGHSAFLITTSNGTRIITDPAEFKGYKMPEGIEADIVTISHEHMDHNNTISIKPGFISLRGCTADNQRVNLIDTLINDIHIYNVPSFHDPGHHGPNSIFVFEFDDIRVVHLGDLGTVLSHDQVSAIGPVDVLLIPVGGKYTIPLSVADAIVNQLCDGSIIIPMHFKTDEFPSLPNTADDFLEGKTNVVVTQQSSINIPAESKQKHNTYYLLRYSN